MRNVSECSNATLLDPDLGVNLAQSNSQEQSFPTLLGVDYGVDPADLRFRQDGWRWLLADTV
jgi:hypothetical protein